MARELHKRLTLPGDSSGNAEKYAEKNSGEKRKLPKLVRFCESAEELEVLKRYKAEKVDKEEVSRPVCSFKIPDENKQSEQSQFHNWLPPDQQISYTNNNAKWKSKIEDMPKPRDPELARRRAAERKRRRQACGKMKAKMRFEARVHEAEKKNLKRQIENLEEENSVQQEMLENALRRKI